MCNGLGFLDGSMQAGMNHLMWGEFDQYQVLETAQKSQTRCAVY